MLVKERHDTQTARHPHTSQADMAHTHTCMLMAPIQYCLVNISLRSCQAGLGGDEQEFVGGGQWWRGAQPTCKVHGRPGPLGQLQFDCIPATQLIILHHTASYCVQAHVPKLT